MIMFASADQNIMTSPHFGRHSAHAHVLPFSTCATRQSHNATKMSGEVNSACPSESCGNATRGENPAPVPALEPAHSPMPSCPVHSACSNRCKLIASLLVPPVRSRCSLQCPCAALPMSDQAHANTSTVAIHRMQSQRLLRFALLNTALTAQARRATKSHSSPQGHCDHLYVCTTARHLCPLFLEHGRADDCGEREL